MIDGLAIGIAPDAVLCCPPQIVHSPAKISALLKMPGQFRRNLSYALAVTLLLPLPNPPMVPYPLGNRHSLVEHFLIQGMRELVTRGHRPIRPLAHPLRTQKVRTPY